MKDEKLLMFKSDLLTKFLLCSVLHVKNLLYTFSQPDVSNIGTQHLVEKIYFLDF